MFRKIFIMSCLVCLITVQAFTAEKIYDPSPSGLLKDLLSDSFETSDRAKAFVITEKPVELMPLLKEKILNDREYRPACTDVLKLYSFSDSLPVWLSILKETGSSSLKISVMDYISMSGNRSIVGPVAAELKNPFQEVRRKAAEILSRTGDDRAYPYVLSMMSNKYPSVRSFGIDAMSSYMYDFRFDREIMKMLDDRDGVVKVYAIRCVRSGKIEGCRKKIISIAVNPGNTQARYAAVEWMQEVLGSSASGEFIRLLGDDDRIIRLAAVNALYRTKPSAAASSICRRLQTEKDEEILGGLLDAVLKAGTVPDTEGVKNILLHSKSVDLRVKAACALRLANDQASMKILIRALSDPDYRVRAEACSSLALYKYDAAADALASVAEGKENRYVRSAALNAIIKSGTRRVTVRLFDLYAGEKDIIFKNMVYAAVRSLIVKYH